jgi:hydroxypyruvate isomerase
MYGSRAEPDGRLVPKFDANLTMLYTDLDFMERFAAAANDGFAAVEYLFPYAYESAELAARLKSTGLEQVLFNLPAGDWAGGERGIACHPDRVAEFRTGVASAIEYAKALACTRVNCLAGKVPAGVSYDAAKQTFVGNLRYAAAELEGAGVTLVIEPVNTYDIPGFFLSGTAPALAIMDEVGSPNLKLQYDVYHMQRTEGELAKTFAANVARIAHVQVADNPGRHEPGTGEINYPFVFEQIDLSGYTGWVGCEYIPLAKTSDGLGWMKGRHE